MGATTKQGRTRNRRAQALNTIINGQQPTLYFYTCGVGVGGEITIGIWDETLTPYPNANLAPDAVIRGILLNGTGAHPFTAPVTLSGESIVFTPSPAPVLNDNLLILSWNEDLRGKNGEWFAGAMLDVLA